LNESQFTPFTPVCPVAATGQLNPFEDIFNDFENVDWTYLSQYLVTPDVYDITRDTSGMNAIQTTQEAQSGNFELYAGDT
jgi:hypothetical protein